MDERSYLLHNRSSSAEPNKWSDRVDYIKRLVQYQKWDKETIKVWICILLLVIFTSIERVCFKMAVDRMTPYRFVTVIFILAISAMVYSIIVFMKRRITNQITPSMSDFPHSRIFSMAVLETLQFAVLFVSAAGVTPTMTLILLNANTLSTVFFTQFVFPERQFSVWQLRGIWLIALAVVISGCRPMMYLLMQWGVVEATCSLLYIAAALLLGISNLYKEYCVIQWRDQPMDIHFLSSWLYLYQVLVAVVLAPLLYSLQNISVMIIDDAPETGGSEGDAVWTWSAYPLDSFWDFVQHGIACVLCGENLQLSAVQTTLQSVLTEAVGLRMDWRKTAHNATTGAMIVTPTEQNELLCPFCNCHGGLWLIVLFILSNIIVTECITVVLQRSSRFLDRSLAVAIFTAFVALSVYDTKEVGLDHPYGVLLFGTSVGIADILSIAILMAGIEVHGKEPLPENIEPIPAQIALKDMRNSQPNPSL